MMREADVDTLIAELDDLNFLEKQLNERRVRLQREVSAGEALAIELLARARDADSMARRAAATDRAVETRQETAATRAQCDAVLAHAYRVRDRKGRLEARITELKRPRQPSDGGSAGRAAGAGGPASRSKADFAKRVDDDLRKLKEDLRRK
ncbi:hypothetical protein T492DRAFT_893686 [Pavlovales sp. CCMP2436]|nr:hypothetical protein T492DRAFT_893686 [Pavlovales sp. CCMP2436]